MIIDAMIETGKLLGALCVVMSVAMVHPSTRRVTFALTHFAKRYAPKWLAPALVVCAFIPGPIDEIAVIAAVLFPVLRNAHNRTVFSRYIRASWKG